MARRQKEPRGDDDSELDAALNAIKGNTGPKYTPLEAGATFAGVAAIAVGAISYAFFDVYLLRSPVQLGALLGVAAVAWYCLYSAYSASGEAANRRCFKATADGADNASRATYFALFQTNFWYFFLVGLMAGVILPIFADSASLLPGGKQTYGAVSAGLSTALPALLVSMSGKTKYF